jgi:CHAT domain-containing protein
MVFHAGTQVYADEMEVAKSALRTLLSAVDSSRYSAVEGRARWMLGTLLSRTDSSAQARAEYRRAEAIFGRLGETEHQSAVLNLDGGLAYDQGDALAGYNAMHGALRALRHYPNSLRLHNQLVDLADRASQDGMPWAGSILLDEAVSVAARFGEPLVMLEARLARADLRAVLGDHRGAVSDLDSIAPLLPLLNDQDARDWTAARLGYTRAVVMSAMGQPPAPAVMDSAVEYFRSAKNLAWLVPTLLRRADVRMAAGDGAGATADLEAAVGYIRNAPGDERDVMLRSAVMERVRSRFDQLVMLRLREKRPDDALRALENGRTSFATAPLRRAFLRAPNGEVAVEYALIGDTLLIWTVRGNSLHLVRKTVNRGEFLLTVEEVGAALESPAGEARAVAGLTRLYDWLVRPVWDRLGETETPVVILADGEIARVPFAALVDSASKPRGRAPGRYLVQDHPLRFAATLSDARRTLPRAPPGRALLVADPAFDRLAHPTLDYLPGARQEVDSLKKLYPDHVPLERAHATRSAVTAEATSAQVIHYAGHAVFNDARPERSMLVLAGPDTTAPLTAEAFHRMRLPNVRLVVLSACGTLRSRNGRSGGFAGFSGALLAAGAGGVVGSLWDVNDERTRHLMWAFHAEYVDSGNAAAALRAAQLKMLSDRDPDLSSPSTWAAFRYAGR